MTLDFKSTFGLINVNPNTLHLEASRDASCKMLSISVIILKNWGLRHGWPQRKSTRTDCACVGALCN